MILSRGLISFRYFSVPIRISFFFARVIATLSRFKSLRSTPLSAVCFVQEIMTMSQSIPYDLSIVSTYFTPYMLRWAFSSSCWSRKGVMIVILEASTPQCLKLSIIMAQIAASMKFLYLKRYRSFNLRLSMTLSVFRNVTERFLISSSQVSIEFTSLGNTTVCFATS